MLAGLKIEGAAWEGIQVTLMELRKERGLQSARKQGPQSYNHKKQNLAHNLNEFVSRFFYTAFR